MLSFFLDSLKDIGNRIDSYSTININNNNNNNNNEEEEDNDNEYDNENCDEEID